MQCHDVKREIALRLGQDPAFQHEWPVVSAHVHECQECRQHYNRLKKTLAHLEQFRQEPTYEVESDLWKGIHSALQQPRPRRLSNQTRYSLSAVMVAASLLMMVNFFNPVFPQNRGDQPLVREISSPMKILMFWKWGQDSNSN